MQLEDNGGNVRIGSKPQPAEGWGALQELLFLIRPVGSFSSIGYRPRMEATGSLERKNMWIHP